MSVGKSPASADGYVPRPIRSGVPPGRGSVSLCLRTATHVTKVTPSKKPILALPREAAFVSDGGLRLVRRTGGCQREDRSLLTRPQASQRRRGHDRFAWYSAKVIERPETRLGRTPRSWRIRAGARHVWWVYWWWWVSRHPLGDGNGVFSTRLGHRRLTNLQPPELTALRVRFTIPACGTHCPKPGHPLVPSLLINRATAAA
jgi:hypothetical protein